MTALVAILAKRNTQELLVLLDVVSIGRAWRPADTTGQFFNGGQVPSF